MTGFFLTAFASVLMAGAATLEEIVAKPPSWPAEVTLTVAARATVLKDGQAAGAMLLGAGKKLVVTQITMEGVLGRVGSTMVRVAVDKTDLMARADAILADGSPALNAPTPPIATSASASPASLSAATATNSGAKPASVAAPSIMQRRLAGKLVRLKGGKLIAADAASLTGVKYYALYYSASWCGPCRSFTPDLVKAYGQLKARHPEFEIVFVSSDRSAADMRDYMHEDRMAWPALNYELRDASSEIVRYGGPGIPCLVLVDAGGVVLSDSFEGGNYVGPRKVLADATRLLQRNR